MTDSCDRCGPAVRAYVFVEIGEHELAYCGHCGTKYWNRLNEVGRVYDFRYLIAEGQNLNAHQVEDDD